jgi:hypothetical protein
MNPDLTATATPSGLDVSLHDDELADEVELTARLMIAANESARPLSPAEVDAALGVAARLLPPLIPAQLSPR